MAKKTQAKRTRQNKSEFWRKLAKLKSRNWVVIGSGAVRCISRSDPFARQCPITAVDDYAGVCVGEESDKRWGVDFCANVVYAADTPENTVYRRKILKALNLKERKDY